MSSKEKRRKEIRRKHRLHNKQQKNKLKAWVKLVKKRDKYRCAICGNRSKSPQGLNAHHIIPKTIKCLAIDPQNGISLCAQHHRLGQFAVHQNALFFSNWLKTNRPEQHRYLMRKLNELERKNEK